MSVLPEFNSRLDEIHHVLEVVREMERRQRSDRRSFYQKGRLIASSRAASYLMMYNAMEAAMRNLMFSIRTQIQQESVKFTDVSEYWRLDAIQARFLHKMASGTNHGNVLTDIIPMTNSSLTWDDTDRERLPFNGNFGQTAAMRLIEQLGLQWKPPPEALGGVDLENIRQRRNALAHGLETFQQAGSQVTAGALQDVLARVRRFMVSYIHAVEKYAEDKKYLTPAPLHLDYGEDHLETPGSFEEAPPQSGA